MRLDRYLTRHLPQTLSRRAVQRAIEAGKVTVGGQPTKAHRLLRAGQPVVARIEELGALSQGTALEPEPIPLEVVHEDDALLVVNKPPGLVTHPAPGHWTGTLVNAVLWHLQNAECGMRIVELKTPHAELRTPHLARAGIVHRLDKETSGLLVVAKTEPARRDLARQLKNRTMSRGYLACVDGSLPQDEGTIDAAIGRHPTHRKRMTVRYLGGRSAVTHYRVLARCEKVFSYTVVELKLQTGRTHQIRVHLAHLGHPVLGDAVYGKHPASYWASHGIARQLLHARTIRFSHPVTQKPLEFSAPIPEDMKPWLPQEVSQ